MRDERDRLTRDREGSVRPTGTAGPMPRVLILMMALLFVLTSAKLLSTGMELMETATDDHSLRLHVRGAETPRKLLHLHYTARNRSLDREYQWRHVNGLDVEIHYFSDADSEALVRENRPEFLTTYLNDLTPVERADYFRYLVLWVHGGVYVDSDIEFITPVHQWLLRFGWERYNLDELDAVVGVEFPNEQTHYNKTSWLPLQFTQYVIAGAKGSEVLKSVVLYVEKTVTTIHRGGDVEMTLERTGPVAFTNSVLEMIRTRGVVDPDVEEMHNRLLSDARHPRALMPVKELEKTGQVISWRRPLYHEDRRDSSSADHGLILVLPYRAFAYSTDHGIAPSAILTQHLFRGSWRPKKTLPSERSSAESESIAITLPEQ